jgi:hypothetical protein
MNIGKILKGIGVIVIICGFISGATVYSKMPSELEYKSAYYKAKSDDILKYGSWGTPVKSNAIEMEYKAQKALALYFIIGGIISGLLFIGFGELITLAKSIDERL